MDLVVPADPTAFRANREFRDQADPRVSRDLLDHPDLWERQVQAGRLGRKAIKVKPGHPDRKATLDPADHRDLPAQTGSGLKWSWMPRTYIIWTAM